MQHIFSNAGDRALQDLLSRQPLLAFDFDGTLSPIVPRPQEARASLPVANALRQLNELLPVAIVTGRAVADVRPRLGFNPRHVVGNHGAEDPDGLLDGGQLAVVQALRDCLSTHVGDALIGSGVSIEDKGASFALHYRLARDREAAHRAIHAFVDRMGAAVKVFEGKCVVNLMAADAADKADAVWSLMERSGASCALFVGDDVNDEPVFERAAPDWVTIRVGREDRHSHARFFLDSHEEVGAFLSTLLRLVRRSANPS